MKIDQLGEAVRLRDKLKALQVDLEQVKEGRMSVRQSTGEHLQSFKNDELNQAFNKALQAIALQKMQHQIDLVIADLEALGVTV